MKSLDDVQDNMSTLYTDLRADRLELKKAAELANIAGKWLKAEQLKLAREMMLRNYQPMLPAAKSPKKLANTRHLKKVS